MAKRRRRSDKEEKKPVNWGMVMVLFIAIIMIGSVIGYVWQGDTTRVKQYGIMFKTTADRTYQAKIKDKTYEFTYLPDSVKDVSIDPGFFNAVKSKPNVVMVFDPKSDDIRLIDLMRYEITQLFYYQGGKNVNNAVTSFNATYPFPIMNCSTWLDESNSTYVYLTSGFNSSIQKENSCYTFKVRSSTDFLAFRDYMYYTLLGVYGQ